MDDFIESWSKFTYDYEFEVDYGCKVKVTIDHPFDNQMSMDCLSRFPLRQRSAFAKKILQNYKAETYCSVSDKEIKNPFAQELEKLFQSGLEIYWMKRPTDTLLIVSASSSTSL